MSLCPPLELSPVLISHPDSPLGDLNFHPFLPGSVLSPEGVQLPSNATECPHIRSYAKSHPPCPTPPPSLSNVLPDPGSMPHILVIPWKPEGALAEYRRNSLWTRMEPKRRLLFLLQITRGGGQAPRCLPILLSGFFCQTSPRGQMPPSYFVSTRALEPLGFGNFSFSRN